MADPVALNATAKRKRSPSAPSAPASKALKTASTSTSTSTSTSNPNSSANANQLQINYLARQCADDLPFITKDDTLPNLLDVLSSYNHVLDRQESLASNLGARPLGPILIKRFERCFDGPPKIIASHSHAKSASNPSNSDDDDDNASASASAATAPTVTWLDVVHFAQAHPAQFDLATFSEGRRVCQFYYPQKQVRVQVSEEDFLFINSGRCQDLIPPLPIWEDEEKEVGTCEILEKALRELTNAADMVAARTRQLGHRLKGRRMAIQERRFEQGHAQADQDRSSHTPPSVWVRPTSFVSANSHTQTPTPARSNAASDKADPSSAIRTDLLKHFQSLPHNQSTIRPDHKRNSTLQPVSPVHAPVQHHTSQPSLPNPPAADVGQATMSTSGSPAPIAALPANGHSLDLLSYYIENNPAPYRPSFTPANQPASSDNAPKHNFSRPLPPSQESSQPYRAICQTHMESLPKGSRILPPCDRCRRLRMDCLKNLSSCAGCTKKHARCHWKDVRRDEVLGLEGFEEADLSQRHVDPVDPDHAPVESISSAPPAEDDYSVRRAGEEHRDQTNGSSAMALPPLRRSELEQRAQASINHAQPDSTLPQPTHHHSHEHYENDVRGGATNFTTNPPPRRTEVEERQWSSDNENNARELLRILSKHPTDVEGLAPIGGPGARNNGAFRSVYNPQGTESSRPNGNSSTAHAASSNASTDLGLVVAVVGGDRL